MSDPYRDELLALRVENERLRRRLDERSRPRGRRTLLAGAAITGSSVGALAALLPLLNAPSDTRFLVGASGVAALLMIDVVAWVVLARWATAARDDR